MDFIGPKIKQITNELKSYVETRIELLVLNLAEKGAILFGDIVQAFLSLTVLVSGLMLCIIALSLYLGELLDNSYLGFLITGGFLTFVGLVLILAKPKNFSKKIQNQVMSDVMNALDTKKKPETIKYLEEKTTEDLK